MIYGGTLNPHAVQPIEHLKQPQKYRQLSRECKAARDNDDYGVVQA